MKKIITLIFFLSALILNAQTDDFFWSYSHQSASDTITIVAGLNNNSQLIGTFATYSGDSLLFINPIDNTITKIQSGVFTGVISTLSPGTKGYLVAKRNDFKYVDFNFFNRTEVKDISQAKTLLKYTANYSTNILGNIFYNNVLLEDITLQEAYIPVGTLDLSYNTSLKNIYIINTPLQSITLPTSSNLYDIFVRNGSTLTSITFGGLNSGVHSFNGYGSSFNQENVDKILKYFVDSNRIPNELGTVDLIDLCGGNNAIPSENGFNYAGILTQRGWNVCVNSGISLPVVETEDATSISSTYASLSGSVISSGSSPVTSRGVCWGTSLNPTIGDNRVNSGTGTGSFTISAYNLLPNTTYHYRAYATNSNGTAYGEDKTFITTSAIQTVPELITTAPTAITTTTASSGGTITFDGNYEIIEKGVCWNTSGTPTYSDSKTNDGTGISSFTSNITGLAPNTTYYVRSFATNRKDAGGLYIYATGYGQEEVFITASSSSCNLPTVTTNVINSITSSSASGGGSVISDGGCEVTVKGLCWSTSPNPTISNSKTTDGGGLGAFSSSMTGLTCGTTYFTRAYATNESGTVYGNSVTFSTELCTYIPTVSLNTINKYGDTYATFSGSVTDDGNSAVIERGFVYSITPNPTTSSNKIISGSGVGVFSANAYGLSSSTKYYVRAYAINSVGTAYSNELDFTTLESPTNVSIFTSVPVNITTSSATLGGNISSDGGNTVTERGVVYGLSINPTTSNTKIQSGNGIGIYSVNVTGLTQGTTYHVRAYAINSAGTFYGADESFITSIEGATACNAGQTFPGGQSYPSTNTVVLGSGTGDVTLTFDAQTIPDFFLVEYNSIIYNSGWRGSSSYDYGGYLRSAFKSALLGKVDPSQNTPFPPTFPNTTLYPEDGYPRVNSATGNIYFTKSTNNPTTATVKVYAPMSDTRWSYVLSCPN